MKFALKYFIYITTGTILLSCAGAKKVTFKNPVDTTTRPITYQAKKTFQITDLGVFATNNFDGARLNGFEKLNDSTALVTISPENTPINNSAYFAFKTWSNTPKPFYFTFKYPKGYAHRYLPKLKMNNEWKMLDSVHLFKKDSIVTIKLNLTKNPLLVAAQEIQSSTDVEQWYTNLIKDKSEVEKINFGTSKLGKKLNVLRIGIGPTKGKKVIVLLTRQHPPEVTGYYAFQSFLATILDGSELSTSFLKKYDILAFPIMNPDGVDLGHWRHNAGGIDLNRDWSVYNQPEVKSTVNYIDKVLKQNDSKLILGIDFHSTWNDVFYTNEIREGTALPNFIPQWFAGLEANIPNYKVNEAAANSTKPVSKGWLLYGHNATGITYEIGDETPRKAIALIGKVSAQEMMKILINN